MSEVNLTDEEISVIQRAVGNAEDSISELHCKRLERLLNAYLAFTPAKRPQPSERSTPGERQFPIGGDPAEWCRCGHHRLNHSSYEGMPQACNQTECECRTYRPDPQPSPVDEDVHGPLCKDGGTCHHRCEAGKCFRENGCAPLSGSGLGDDWKPLTKPIDHGCEHEHLLNNVCQACGDKCIICPICSVAAGANRAVWHMEPSCHAKPVDDLGELEAKPPYPKRPEPYDPGLRLSKQFESGQVYGYMNRAEAVISQQHNRIQSLLRRVREAEAKFAEATHEWQRHYDCSNEWPEKYFDMQETADKAARALASAYKEGMEKALEGVRAQKWPQDFFDARVASHNVGVEDSIAAILALIAAEKESGEREEEKRDAF